MKLKYTGKEIVYLRLQNMSMKLKPNQIIDIPKEGMKRFEDRKEFKKVK